MKKNLTQKLNNYKIKIATFFRPNRKGCTLQFVLWINYTTKCGIVKEKLMSNDKKNLKQSNNVFEEVGQENTSYNRKNVDSIKRLIVIAALMVCVFPVLFCLYLMVRMGSIERKLDELAYKLESGLYIQSEAEENVQDVVQETHDGNEILAKDNNDTNLLAEASESENVFEAEPEPMIDSSGDSMEAPVVEKNGKKVYLTFDDGPSEYTDELLDILAANNVKATFFVVYNDDESLWPAYDRIVKEGHTLGMHSYSHIYDEVYKSEESFINDVESIHDFIYEQTGIDSKLYRFPGGSSNSVSSVDIQSLIGYLYDRGITYYDWNALSGDAVSTGLDATQLNNNILDYVRSNEGDSIVLMHDIKNCHATIEGLQSLIDTLISEGYELCPIDSNTPLMQHVKFIPETEE